LVWMNERHRASAASRLAAMACVVVSLLATLGLTGCGTLELVTPYDEVTDKAITALQKKTDTHLESLTRDTNKPRCEHAQHANFYAESRVDMNGLIVRAAAFPDNARSEERLTLMLNSLDAFEKLHRLGCLSVAQIEALRVDLNRGYTAILKAELAKKRR
jgi:hypothetical protein